MNATVQYKNWNLTFESTVLPVKMRASVLFEGTDGTLEIARDGYTFTPNKGEPEVVKASGDLGKRARRQTISKRAERAVRVFGYTFLGLGVIVIGLILYSVLFGYH